MSEQGAMRVSDVDRAQMADRLARAYGEGRLTLAEYDERVRAAHGAVVGDDLAPLVTDLPSDAPERAPEAPRDRRGPESRWTSSSSPGRYGVPVPPGFPVPSNVPGRHGCPGPPGLRAAVAAWAVVSAVNLLIWLAVVLGTGTLVHPWWFWVAGPWGLALVLAAAGRGRAAPRAAGRLPS